MHVYLLHKSCVKQIMYIVPVYRLTMQVKRTVTTLAMVIMQRPVLQLLPLEVCDLSIFSRQETAAILE